MHFAFWHVGTKRFFVRCVFKAITLGIPPDDSLPYNQTVFDFVRQSLWTDPNHIFGKSLTPKKLRK